MPDDEKRPTLKSISAQLEDLKRRLTAQPTTSPTVAETTKKEPTVYIAFTTFVFTAFAAVAVGSLFLTYDAVRSAQERAYSDIMTQVSSRADSAVGTLVPIAVNEAVQTAVPEVVRIAAETGVARDLPTYWLTLVPTAQDIFATPPNTSVPSTPGVPTPQPQPRQYAIIVASDTTTTYVIRYAASLRAKGYQAQVFKIGDVYALVADTFDSIEALQEALIAAKSALTENAYFIDLTKSCFRWQFINPGYFDCVEPPL